MAGKCTLSRVLWNGMRLQSLALKIRYSLYDRFWAHTRRSPGLEPLPWHSACEVTLPEHADGTVKNSSL
jgi:hypothetical protein